MPKAIAAIVMFLWFGCASAQAEYPARPVRVVAPFPPGQGRELIARALAHQFTQAMGQNFKQQDYRGFSAKAMRVGGPMGVPSVGCYEVLQNALKGYRIAPENIPEPFNLFQTLEFKEDKSFSIVDGRSKPGDYIEFLAKMDTLCALSACPSMGRPFQVQVFAE